MIDEKKLIEAIETYAKDKTDIGYWYDRLWGMRMAIEIINQQPKIGEWIPCSERLPNSTFNVEVTTKDNKRTIGYYAGYAGNWYSPITDDLIFVKAWKEPSDPWEGE